MLRTGAQIVAARALLRLSLHDLALIAAISPAQLAELEESGDRRAGFDPLADVLRAAFGIAFDGDAGRVSVSAPAELAGTPIAAAARLAVVARLDAIRGAGMTARQAERAAARAALLSAFETMRGPQSSRAVMPVFLAAYRGGRVELPDWTRPLLPARLSKKTLQRWLSARNKGGVEALAPRWRGPTGLFDKHREVRDAAVALITSTPFISSSRVAAVVRERFPVEAARVSDQTVRRFMASLQSAGNLDPMSRAKNRFLR